MHKLSQMLLFGLTLCMCSAYAQKDSIIYFNMVGKPIPKSDTAAYYRVIHNQTEQGFTFTEHRKDSSWVEASALGTLANWQYNGYVNWYYKNGKPCEMHLYTKNTPTKTLRYYYNGLLHQTIVYDAMPGMPYSRLLYEADSTGKENIFNGNGRRKESGKTFLTSNKSELFTMEGPYRDGARDGLWKGSDEYGILFEEKYEKGRLINGKSKSVAGKKYNYDVIYKQAFYEYPREIERQIRYHLNNPSDTLNLKANIAHVLSLSYTIKQDGTLADICGYSKADDSPVKLSLKSNPPKVTPAKLRGIPVVSYISQPYTISDGVSRIFNADFYLNGQYIPIKGQYLPF